LINDFRHLELRNDQGPLFENYMINEINKQNEYLQIDANMYFWRTSDQKEVDLILEKNGMLYAFEFKWSASKKSNITKSFSNKYLNHVFFDVNKENYFDFLNTDFFEKQF
jgi:predicted AAA+ superfamily ATPase